MYDMCANIFSVNPNLIISSKNFVRLNKELRDRGFKVEEVKYNETAKMEGLLRCSTLPLRRS
jgi:N-dimethylarginine dimethylaminohydrolase